MSRQSAPHGDGVDVEIDTRCRNAPTRTSTLDGLGGTHLDEDELKTTG